MSFLTAVSFEMWRCFPTVDQVAVWLRAAELCTFPQKAEMFPDFPNIPPSTADMEFVQIFTPLDFQVKNFTPPILPNFNSFSKKKTQKMSENGEIYTAGKNFTLPPGLTGWTNSTSDYQ